MEPAGRQGRILLPAPPGAPRARPLLVPHFQSQHKCLLSEGKAGSQGLTAVLSHYPALTELSTQHSPPGDAGQPRTGPGGPLPPPAPGCAAGQGQTTPSKALAGAGVPPPQPPGTHGGPRGVLVHPSTGGTAVPAGTGRHSNPCAERGDAGVMPSGSGFAAAGLSWHSAHSDARARRRRSPASPHPAGPPRVLVPPSAIPWAPPGDSPCLLQAPQGPAPQNPAAAPAPLTSRTPGPSTRR